jgi:tetratricopeptide (TPR) repeat protein
MHRLVQLSVRRWLERSGNLEKWKQQFITHLCVAMPTGDYENWIQCQVLFPHVRSALSQKPERDDSLREWATILYRAAWYSWLKGNADDAKEMSIQATKARVKLLGPNHGYTLWSMDLIGRSYNIGGEWEKAEKVYRDVMEMSKTKLRADHPDTLSSMANLASTYRNQGRWDAAEELEVQVMEMSKTKLGADHPGTLTSMANLASTYRNQGRWDAAEELDVQVMEIRKTKLGADHPDTLTSMANLASTYRVQGRNVEAVGLMRECVRRRQHILGADHPHSLSSSRALARWEGEQASAGLSFHQRNCSNCSPKKR